MLSLSRRNLLASTSSIILSRAIEPNFLCAAEGTTSGSRRINLGLSGIAYYSLCYPFLNVWKSAGAIQVVTGDSSYWSSAAPGETNSAWDNYLDSDGELVSPLATGITRLTRVFYAQPSDGLPKGYNRVGEQWLLKWDGAAANVSIDGASTTKRIGNRIIWTWGSNTSNMWVSFTGMDRNNPPRNIRLCEARHEALLDAGEIFNPEWIKKVREGSGIVRFMTWQSVNFDRSTLRFSDIPLSKYCSYGRETRKPFIKGGVPLEFISNLANKVQSHPWVCIPNVLGTKKLSAIAVIGNSNPAVVKSPGHKWVNGDKVIPYGTDWPQIEKTICTVINSNPRDGTFALAEVDSRSFSPYKSTWSSVTSLFDLNAIASEVERFSAHFRDNVAVELTTYFEFSNEIWNFSFNAPHWLAAQARAKFGRDDNNKMGGYLAAHCMKIIRDTYKTDGRHRWRGVLATQTVNTAATNAMIAGAKQYIEENALSLRVADLFADLAVTGYFGGPFIEKNKLIVINWMDLSERRWREGLEPTKYAYFNRIVNEDCADGRHTGHTLPVDKIVQFWRAQKAIADAHGLDLLQYEGGNHNDPKLFGSLTADERARFMEFYKQCCHTSEDAQNYETMFNNFASLGGKYPSKFVEMGPVSRYGSWGGLRYLGDSNPVWDAVVAFNAARLKPADK